MKNRFRQTCLENLIDPLSLNYFYVLATTRTCKFRNVIGGKLERVLTHFSLA